ncbi:MAG: hypothetical protein EP330_04040 [Deltaproteobacteria bacterium]|nr:MAG: hypothetical protein EP330_04040 [Deltaproteobacteria bacterium]
MRWAALWLLCSLSAGCTGSDAPGGTEARSPAPAEGGSSSTPSKSPATAGEAGEPGSEPVGVHCTGSVLTARESPPNKRFPDRGGHWILEVQVEEWDAADESAAPSTPLRLIVPREVVESLVPRPVEGERYDVVAKLVAGKPDTATADALTRL